MDKKKIGRLVSCLAFLLCTLALLYLAANTLRARQTTLSALYSEPDRSVDMIVVGSSHVNSGYMPNVFWEKNHLSACNVYSWSQPIWTSYYYIKEALKTQKPSIVVLEMYGMTYGHSYIMPEEIDKTNYANSFNMDIDLNYLGLIRTAEQVGIDRRPYEDFLNLPRYHTRWKLFGPELFAYNAHKSHDPLKGYGLTYATTVLEDPNLQSDAITEPYEFSVAYLDRIVKLCAEKNITLIFTMTPYVYNETEVGINNWIAAYAEQKGIRFLNYNGADGKRVGIDYTTDFSNMAHLNFYGASKVTNDLAAVLAESVVREKAQNQNAVALDEDYAKYERILTANEIMTTNTLPGYLEKALADQEYSFFLVNSGAQTGAQITNTLAAAGLALPKDETHFTLAVGRDGLVTTDAETLAFDLFGEKGSVSMKQGENGAEIDLNGRAAYTVAESDFELVLYDNVLDRPLETVTLNADGTLAHREFTSDIIDLFRQ